jgi:hypothetical protein
MGKVRTTQTRPLRVEPTLDRQRTQTTSSPERSDDQLHAANHLQVTALSSIPPRRAALVLRPCPSVEAVSAGCRGGTENGELA